jgi:hypothetical protein
VFANNQYRINKMYRYSHISLFIKKTNLRAASCCRQEEAFLPLVNASPPGFGLVNRGSFSQYFSRLNQQSHHRSRFNRSGLMYRHQNLLRRRNQLKLML